MAHDGLEVIMCKWFYTKIKEYSRLLWNLFLPRCCTVCGRELFIHENYLCLACYAAIPLTYFWKVKDNPAEIVFWGRTRIERTYALYYYTNHYRNLIYALKYKSNIGIGLYMGKLLGKKIAEDTIGFSIIHFIIPVPLHSRKKRKRGYNQSQIIAKGIKMGLLNTGISPIIPNLLKRKNFTKTQTQKDRIHRWYNVADAFEINYRVVEKIKNMYPGTSLNILLVDDVLTTGATLEACCNIIHKHLNCKISIATLAYVE